MPLKQRDLAYLWDMREAAREIQQSVRGISFAMFEKNHVIRYAVERQLFVIGEAASHVSEEFREKHLQIPWAQIMGQKNFLTNENGEIHAERVWLTATKTIPELIRELDRLLK